MREWKNNGTVEIPLHINQEISQLVSDIKLLLSNDGKTLSVAESCTGGGIASVLTSVPGASEYFKGGVVAYQNEIKVDLLGVPYKTIQECDVVSTEVVERMVIGSCKLFNSDYALSTSGYAGPSGGNANVPLGTICIGYGKPSDTKSYVFRTCEDRATNVEFTILQALRLLKVYIESDLGKV